MLTFENEKQKFTEYLKQIYTDIDFDNDYQVVNKVNELVYMLVRRMESPLKEVEKREDVYFPKNRWR